MRKKNMYFFASLICISVILFLVGCSKSNNNSAFTCLKDIAYTQNDSIDNTVYLYEMEKLTPYLVLDDNYSNSGNVLLLRKYVLDETRNMNDNTSYYPDSLMDKFLNESFLPSLALQEKICDTEILVTKFIEFDGMETIERKVFLLSATETGNKSDYSMWKEGETLEYFKILKNRDAYREDGTRHTWWLRTRDLSYNVCNFIQGRDAYFTSGDCKNNMNSVRPAFCMDADMPITTQLYEGKEIYVIEE